MNPLTHFEIQADDIARAKDFYEKVFGWEITKWDDGEGAEYWNIKARDKGQVGLNGGLMKRMEPLTGMGFRSFVCSIEVPSVDDYIEKVKDNGGKVVVDKMEVGKMGWMAYCLDTEGNQFGLFEYSGAEMSEM